MAQVSPPKPWERGGAGAASSIPTSAPSSQAAASTTTPSATASSTPALPSRPSTLSTVTNANAANLANPASTTSALARPYASTYTSPYSSSMYSSPYSRFGSGYGGYGSSMYGGGMYGSGYGGMYGNSMYGGGMYGGGGMMGPNGEMQPGMVGSFAQSTQASFQMIEGLVQAFGGFAQMLESTYMATHSSFFAMISVAEQLSSLRQTLGSILGIFTLLRWARTLLAKLTGRPPPADATALTPSNFFSQFPSLSPPTLGPDGLPQPKPAKPSKKPFIVFLVAVFGLPYLMGRMIRAISRSQEEQLAAQQQGQQQQIDPVTGQLIPAPAAAAIDPSTLSFCRVLYPFPPPDAIANGTFVRGSLDLEVKKGDLVAVLDKSDPDAQVPGKEGDWWRCRARDGRMGYLPKVYLESVQRRAAPPSVSQSAPGSRANTMPGSVASGMTLVGEGGGGSRSQSLTSVAGAQAPQNRAQSLTAAAMSGKGSVREMGKKESGGQGVEGFQKAWVAGQ